MAHADLMSAPTETALMHPAKRAAGGSAAPEQYPAPCQLCPGSRNRQKPNLPRMHPRPCRDMNRRKHRCMNSGGIA